MASKPEPRTLKQLTVAVGTPSWQLQLSSPESWSLIAIMSPGHTWPSAPSRAKQTLGHLLATGSPACSSRSTSILTVSVSGGPWSCPGGGGGSVCSKAPWYREPWNCTVLPVPPRKRFAVMPKVHSCTFPQPPACGPCHFPPSQRVPRGWGVTNTDTAEAQRKHLYPIHQQPMTCYCRGSTNAY